MTSYIYDANVPTLINGQYKLGPLPWSKDKSPAALLELENASFTGPFTNVLLDEHIIVKKNSKSTSFVSYPKLKLDSPAEFVTTLNNLIRPHGVSFQLETDEKFVEIVF